MHRIAILLQPLSVGAHARMANSRGRLFRPLPQERPYGGLQRKGTGFEFLLFGRPASGVERQARIHLPEKTTYPKMRHAHVVSIGMTIMVP